MCKERLVELLNRHHPMNTHVPYSVKNSPSIFINCIIIAIFLKHFFKYSFESVWHAGSHKMVPWNSTEHYLSMCTKIEKISIKCVLLVTANPLISYETYPSIRQSVCQSSSQSFCQLIHPSVSRSVSQSVCQSASQLVCQLAGS